jgi:hypothetical protein
MSVIHVSIKPYHCQITDNWADDSPREVIIHEQSYGASDSKKNVGI